MTQTRAVYSRLLVAKRGRPLDGVTTSKKFSLALQRACNWLGEQLGNYRLESLCWHQVVDGTPHVKVLLTAVGLKEDHPTMHIGPAPMWFHMPGFGAMPPPVQPPREGSG